MFIFFVIQKIYSLTNSRNPSPKLEMKYAQNHLPQWNSHKNI